MYVDLSSNLVININMKMFLKETNAQHHYILFSNDTLINWAYKKLFSRFISTKWADNNPFMCLQILPIKR